ncbi:hypothetical protein N7G274_001104 [Stereocaulon virgatum]|uniref:Peptidase M1 leukotriene A4 hydrolase/aminopeptidase C-terminal domain-containing protein n=1 Tax=Stereocaulon virgatum TaxID=373712 RepID=A0ABR4APA1_9LECA
MRKGTHFSPTYKIRLARINGTNSFHTTSPLLRDAHLKSYEFKANLLAFFESDFAAFDALNKVEWDAWLYGTGLPPKPVYDTSSIEVCYKLAAKWSRAKAENFEPKAEDISGWSANQVVLVLDSVQEFVHKLDKLETEAMESVYALAKSGDAEVMARYYRVALKAKDDSVYKPTVELFGKDGRMKFVLPLYKWLNEADRQLAVETFEKNRVFYHLICRRIIEKDLFGKRTRRRNMKF